TVTVIVGRSIFGKRSTPSELYEKSPTTVRLKISIVANTGRRTQISASFCIVKFESKVQRPKSKVRVDFLTLDFGLWTLDCYCLTAIPSLNCSTLLVATTSFSATPLLISTRSPSVCPNCTCRSCALPSLITKTRLTPDSVRTARLGTSVAGAARDCRIRTVANCPGFNAPLLFSISASTVNVREVGVTFGEIRATRPLKFLSGHALVVTDTDWPTLTEGIACSGISMRTRRGLILTMVATLVVVETYSPRSAERSET